MKNRTTLFGQALRVSLIALLLAASGCRGADDVGDGGSDGSSGSDGDGSGGDGSDGGGDDSSDPSDVEDQTDEEGSVSVLPGTILDTPETAVMFTARDMEQTADTSTATTIELVSGQDVTISEAGVYVISGDVEDVTIIVEADAEAKVQLVLSGASVTNTDAPVIYVKSADKVYVTTVGESHLEVGGAFVPDGETNLDAVIFSKEDLVLNGTGSLEVVSAQGNGVTSKDDLKITGGTIIVDSALDGIEANDSIRIAGGDLTITSGKDGLHAENEEDDSLGYVYIAGGTLRIAAVDDGIQGTSVVQIDGGTIDITASTEGIEATYVQINDGDISVQATDDGINASAKSTAYDVTIEVNGGDVYVEVTGNDVDGFDANGDLFINGGTITVVVSAGGPSGAFDFDGIGQLNGGTVTVNGEVITELAVEGGPGGGP